MPMASWADDECSRAIGVERSLAQRSWQAAARMPMVRGDASFVADVRRWPATTTQDTSLAWPPWPAPRSVVAETSPTGYEDGGRPLTGRPSEPSIANDVALDKRANHIGRDVRDRDALRSERVPQLRRRRSPRATLREDTLRGVDGRHGERGLLGLRLGLSCSIRWCLRGSLRVSPRPRCTCSRRNWSRRREGRQHRFPPGHAVSTVGRERDQVVERDIPERRDDFFCERSGETSDRLLEIGHARDISASAR